MTDAIIIAIKLLVSLVFYAIAAVIIGLLAARKNRNAWAWALIGGLFLLPGLLVLMFMSYLCPKCKNPILNKEWRDRRCPWCGDLQKAFTQDNVLVPQDKVLVPQGNVLVLVMATMAFTLSSGLWILMGPLSSFIFNTQWFLSLSYMSLSVLITIPILVGSVMRIPMGMLTDKYGGRIVMSGLLLFSSLVAALGWFVDGYTGLLIIGFFYGMCGTSFAVGIAQVTRWYPVHNQGLALAIFGSGNVGTVLATLFAAKMVKGWFGRDWHPAFPIYALPLFLMAFIYFFTVKNAPVPSAAKKLGDMLTVFKHGMVWILCLFYFVTFGYFVCFSLYLAPFYKFTFNLTPTVAGYMAAIFCFIASVTMPIGGWDLGQMGGRIHPVPGLWSNNLKLNCANKF